MNKESVINQVSIMERPRRSSPHLESLEQRQLLATVIGTGEEVGSNISFQGNVYDQILMTGTSVTVEADPGQIVRASWLDVNGDILQGEFSGAGQLSISLDDFSGPAEATNYNQPGIEYVTGHASFTIEGSDSTSNFSLSTVGPVTSPIFESLRVNGVNYDGIADAARLIIVSDPTQPGGSTFGGIRMANSLLTDDSGIVGITASGVQVQSVVIIGEIDADNTGVPSLVFGAASQFGTIQVAGGDLAQTNGVAISNIAGSFGSVNFIDGTDSHGNLLPADAFAGVFSNPPGNTATLDPTDDFNITGLSQAELDDLFLGKTFINNVNIIGDLPLQSTITATEFRGDVIFDGNVEGAINVNDGVGGDIIFEGVTSDPNNLGAGDRTISADITILGPLTGSLIFGAASDIDAVNFDGTFAATSTGENSIEVWGDFSGVFSTDVITPNRTFDAGEGALGSIMVSGDYSGMSIGILGIGDIAIGGDLTGNTTDTKFYTSSGNTGDAFFADIGSLSVVGDTNLGDGGILIDVDNNGNFGDVNLMGGGSNVGIIRAGNNGGLGGGILGGTNAITGNVTITGATGSSVNAHGISLDSGTLGDLNINGSGDAGIAFNLNDAANTGINVSSLSNTTIDGFDTIAISDPVAIADSANDFIFDTNPGATNPIITVTGGIAIANTSGNFTFSSGNNSVDGSISGTDLGDFTFNGDTDFTADLTGVNIGAVTIDGDANFNTGFGIKSTGLLTSLDITGSTTFGAGTEIGLHESGTLSFGGNVTFAGGTSIFADDSSPALDIIGGLVFNGRVVGVDNVVDVQASQIGDITVQGALTTAGTSLVTDFNVLAIPNAGTVIAPEETVVTNGSNLDSYSIGNITIETTNAIGISNSSLFDNTTPGNINSFVALGKIGNIKLTAGGSEVVQTRLFSIATDGVVFKTGDTSPGAPNVAPTLDFDGDGVNDTYNDISGGTVSIGNITVNVASIDPASDFDTAALINGDGSTTDANPFVGLNILSGVNAFGGPDNAVDDDGTNSNLSEAGELMVRNDNELKGTIGTITILNKTVQLGTEFNADISTGFTVSNDDENWSGIVAATAMGNINGQAAPATSLEAYLIGAETGGGANDSTIAAGEIVAYIV